jgi:hypothetical protein
VWDPERTDAYLETFVVTSWAERLHQHERMTRGDSALAHLIADEHPGQNRSCVISFTLNRSGEAYLWRQI